MIHIDRRKLESDLFMVFKWLTLEKNGDNAYKDVWHFMDNVHEAIVSYDEKINATIIRLCFNNDDIVDIVAGVENYLISDSGKTIERLKCSFIPKDFDIRQDGSPIPIFGKMEDLCGDTSKK